MPGPEVTVIIAAFDAMPYVTRSVGSVLRQSLGADRIELIAVDDGSTDGTAAELDRLAERAPLMHVIHQPNSGGPAGPRNLGLDRATGRYVFFLDADDHLGPEALERMVAAADENGSDVVLGRIVGEGGRRAPGSMFRRNQPRTDVFSSRVYWTLNPMKLFRRELIDRLGLRFDTGLSIGEDQPFVATAYLEAAAISVVADHDCVHWVAREDGNNITAEEHAARTRVDLFRKMTGLVAARVPAGPGRDTLMHRHYAIELRDAVLQLSREPQRETQDKLLYELADLVALHWTDGLAARLPAVVRLRCHLIRHRLLDELLTLVHWELDRGAATYGITTLAAKVATGPELRIEAGRAYALYPYFRDPALNIPEDCYDITAELPVRHRVDSAGISATGLRLTGHARIHRISTRDVTTELVLRKRGTDAERRLPVHHTPTPGLGADEDGGLYTYDLAGYDVTVDLASLTPGLWDLSLAVGAQGIVKEVRLGSSRADSVTTATTMLVTDTGTAVALYTTKPYGNLTLDVGETRHRVRPHLRVTGAEWSADAPATLVVKGRCGLASRPQGALTVRAAGPHGEEERIRVEPAPSDGTFTVRIPCTIPGERELTLSLAVADKEWSVPVPPQPSLKPARWRRFGLPWYAKPLPGRDALTLRVGRVELLKAVRRRLAKR
ncbi:glycosyltransferase family 2 protein [Streptosporangium nondiastaticum]|uniref:Glycosyltransferase family 2 protein n=1 Tax=Streptosporangium nondiastaticum TaxID=35764 RepID=A0A9X7JPF9_9ACTN|nr:glycosyltransferase family 2 protein [Streptosporangium nondiastaticum]PSJ27366.1 glycosyltransferase family 2 protein [Streptosporangium nondiastaticum]